MIENGKNGSLVDFFDIDRMADIASKVLDAPGDFKHLGKAGTAMIQEHFSLDVCLPRMLELYEMCSDRRIQVRAD
jgi:hypothetical protein